MKFEVFFNSTNNSPSISFLLQLSAEPQVVESRDLICLFRVHEKFLSVKILYLSELYKKPLNSQREKYKKFLIVRLLILM